MGAAAEFNLPFTYNLNNVKLGSATDYLLLNGQVGLGIEVVFNVDIDVQWPSVDWEVTQDHWYDLPDVDVDVTPPSVKLKSMEFSTTFSETVDLDITANINLASLDYEKSLVEHEFAPVTFAIGPVPVVLVPYVDLHVGAEGQVSAGITFGVVQKGSVWAVGENGTMLFNDGT